MDDIRLYTRLSSLPPNLKKEVSDFIDFLKSRTADKTPLKERKFGYAKGFFEAGKDFDEPLDDFREYM